MVTQQYDFDDIVAIQDIISIIAKDNLGDGSAQSVASFKEDGSIVTAADITIQQALTHSLKERFPEVQMLGEEIPAEAQQATLNSGADFWCLDPIDGTTNFHAAMPLFSISLGLISRGEIVLAVIYDPNRKEFFAALKGQGFWINGEPCRRPVQPGDLSSCIAFIDFKRLPHELSISLIKRCPFKSQRNIGTCALEWAWIAAGRAHLLIHGSERLWDYAAGVLLCDEAGGASQSFDASPVFQHSLQSRSVIAASDLNLFELWSKRVRQDL